MDLAPRRALFKFPEQKRVDGVNQPCRQIALPIQRVRPRQGFTRASSASK
jgi:hypothetical protein